MNKQNQQQNQLNSKETSDEMSTECNSTLGFQNNFDLIPKLIESTSNLDSQTFTPKILKMFDSVQASFDLQNEFLAEHVPKLREGVLIDLARKSSDLTYRQQLQQMLIDSLNSNDLAKASLINSFLNPTVTNNSNSPQLGNLLDLFSQITPQTIKASNTRPITHTPMDTTSTEPEPECPPLTNTETLNQNQTLNNLTPENESQSETGNNSTLDENQNESADETIVIDHRIRPRLRAGPMSPIRHLICSPGLEATAHKYKIIVLYRGVCNGYCNPNKPWSKEVHLHYIVNTVNCNDHISRLVKKQGIQFYNSFVLQSSDRWNQLIQLYKMEKVKQPKLNQTL